jgi:hypothetical protein
LKAGKEGQKRFNPVAGKEFVFLNPVLYDMNWFKQKPFFPVLLSLLYTQARARAHTHTHTHVYV